MAARMVAGGIADLPLFRTELTFEQERIAPVKISHTLFSVLSSDRTGV